MLVSGVGEYNTFFVGFSLGVAVSVTEESGVDGVRLSLTKAVSTAAVIISPALIPGAAAGLQALININTRLVTKI